MYDNIKFIAAQILGALALVLIGVSYRVNRKKTLLKYQALSNLSLAVQYFLLGAYTGFFLHFVCVLRNRIYNRYPNGEVPVFWLILTEIILIGLLMFSYVGWISLLPAFGVVINTYALWQKKIRFARFAEIIAAVSCIIYCLYFRGYTGMLANLFEAIITFGAIYKYDIKRKRKKKK